MESAVFVDRDGTLLWSRHKYVRSVADYRFLEGALDALVELSALGYRVFIFTNQPGVSANRMTLDEVEKIHYETVREVDRKGGRVDGLLLCPHLPRSRCDCRKPKIGLLRHAAEDYDLNLFSSYVIGDRLSDIQAGRSAGCKTVLVLTGWGVVTWPITRVIRAKPTLSAWSLASVPRLIARADVA